MTSPDSRRTYEAIVNADVNVDLCPRITQTTLAALDDACMYSQHALPQLSTFLPISHTDSHADSHADSRADSCTPLAYREMGNAWVSLGLPSASPAARLALLRASDVAAHQQNKRFLCFGASQRDAALWQAAGGQACVVGEWSWLHAAHWQKTIQTTSSLRAQVKRAAKKGVRFSPFSSFSSFSPFFSCAPLDTATQTPDEQRIYDQVLQLRTTWLTHRRMAPLAFAASPTPFYGTQRLSWYAQSQETHLDGFLSALPIMVDGLVAGYMVEHLWRHPQAPQGTLEGLLDVFLQDLLKNQRAPWVTLGLSPLMGEYVPAWLKRTASLSSFLYSFSGLHSFKEKLRPTSHSPVYLLWSRGPAVLAVYDLLRAFTPNGYWAFLMTTLRLYISLFLRASLCFFSRCFSRGQGRCFGLRNPLRRLLDGHRLLRTPRQVLDRHLSDG